MAAAMGSKPSSNHLIATRPETHHTWLLTLEADLQPLNHGLNSAWRHGQRLKTMEAARGNGYAPVWGLPMMIMDESPSTHFSRLKSRRWVRALDEKWNPQNPPTKLLRHPLVIREVKKDLLTMAKLVFCYLVNQKRELQYITCLNMQRPGNNENMQTEKDE